MIVDPYNDDLSDEQLAHELGYSLNTIIKWRKTDKWPKHVKAYLSLHFANAQLRQKIDIWLIDRKFESSFGSEHKLALTAVKAAYISLHEALGLSAIDRYDR